jgi:hypothetical protein
MANPDLRSLEEYEIFRTEKVTPWSPQQRALAAAVAERWLPAYESFSAEEDWGDPAGLRRSLDAVWSHIESRELAERDAARRIQQTEAYGRFRRPGGADWRKPGSGASSPNSAIQFAHRNFFPQSMIRDLLND